MNGGGADMRSWLQTWEWKTKLPKWAKELVLDFSEVDFIEPWSLALFAAYALRMRQEFGVQARPLLAPANPANVYVERMGISHVLETGESTTDWDDSRQNTGLHVIRNHGDITRFVKSVSQLGAGPTDPTMDALKYGMVELGRNVVQHAFSPIGGVAIAQYFPDRQSIQIAIADCGQGVYQSLKVAYPELRNDLESLKLSLLPHVSGAPTPGAYSTSPNAGLGLFFSKEICWRSGGSFWIASREALLGVQGHDLSARNRVYKKINRWDGTLVAMDLPSAGVEDFSDLLDVCRTLAADAREKSGPSALDFLDQLPELKDVAKVNVGSLEENIEEAAKIRDAVLLPAIKAGQSIVLDFDGVRFVTQSLAHALLNDAFRIPGSLMRISFINCTRSTEEAIRTVAAYAASYRMIV